MPRVLVFAVMPLVVGCYSTVVHPTRVDNSFRLGAALSVSAVTDSSFYGEGSSVEAQRSLFPTLDLEASLGIRDTSVGDPGFGLRLSGRAGLSGYGGAAYVELPRAWAGDIDAGFGVQAHQGRVDFVMPYFQFGAMRGTESSWFLRNGVASVATSDSTDRRLLWLPTVGWYRHRRNGIDGGLFLSAVIGNQPFVHRECILFGCLAAVSGGGVRTFLILGMTVSAPLASDPVRR